MKTTTPQQRRRANLRSQISAALTAQTRDGAGAIELSHILDDSARAICDALLPLKATTKPQARIALGARLLARGLAILADTLDADEARTSAQIEALAEEYALTCRCGVKIRNCKAGCTLLTCCGGYVGEGHMSDCTQPGTATIGG